MGVVILLNTTIYRKILYLDMQTFLSTRIVCNFSRLFCLVYSLNSPSLHSPLYARRCKSTSESSLDFLGWGQTDAHLAKNQNPRAENEKPKPMAQDEDAPKEKNPGLSCSCQCQATNAPPSSWHYFQHRFVLIPDFKMLLPARRRRCDILWVSLVHCCCPFTRPPGAMIFS